MTKLNKIKNLIKKSNTHIILCLKSTKFNDNIKNKLKQLFDMINDFDKNFTTIDTKSLHAIEDIKTFRTEKLHISNKIMNDRNYGIVMKSLQKIKLIIMTDLVKSGNSDGITVRYIKNADGSCIPLYCFGDQHGLDKDINKLYSKVT